MGISFSHGNAGWSYSGFNEFRIRLAREVGIYLPEMEGYANTWKHGCDAGVYPGPHPAIPWCKTLDSIVPLLTMLDVDGRIGDEVCINVAVRLRELVAGR